MQRFEQLKIEIITLYGNCRSLSERYSEEVKNEGAWFTEHFKGKE